MALFLSTYTNRLDRKGRVSVPATYRAALMKTDGTGIAVLCDFNQNCLKAFDVATLEAMAQGMQDEVNPFAPVGSETVDMLAIFEETRVLEWDAEGRVVLPPDFVTFAQLDEEACFVGQGAYFEIWNPAAHAERRAAVRERLKVNPPQISMTGKRRTP